MVQDAFRRIAVPKTLRSLQYALFRGQGQLRIGAHYTPLSILRPVMRHCDSECILNLEMIFVLFLDDVLALNTYYGFCPTLIIRLWRNLSDRGTGPVSSYLLTKAGLPAVNAGPRIHIAVPYNAIQIRILNIAYIIYAYTYRVAYLASLLYFE